MYTAQLQAGTYLAPQRGQVNVLVDGHGSTTLLTNRPRSGPRSRPRGNFYASTPDAETVQLRRWKLSVACGLLRSRQ